MDVITPHPLESDTEPPADDYQRLLVALQDAAPGDFVFVQINSPVQRRQLPEKLVASGLRRSFAIFDFAAFPPGPPPHSILREFLEDQKSASSDILFVDGLEYWIDANPKPGGTLETLNLGREQLANLGVVLVFLLPTYLINIIRSHALNLWSWRAYYYSLEPNRAESIPRDRFYSLGMGYEATPGDTPEDRDRRIRILQRLLDKELAEDRSLDSLIQPVLLPLARELYAAGRFTGALTVLDRLGVDSAKGADATILNFRALVLEALGKFKEAEQLYFTLQEKNLGQDHSDVATILHNLSLLYDHQGKYTEAEHLEEQAYKIWEKCLGPEHPHIATSLDNLAGLYRVQGKYSKAGPLFQKALSIREKVFGPNNIHVASSLNGLAALHYMKGEYLQAELLSERALHIREKILGENHPEVANSLNTLAEIYRAQGKYIEAGSFLRRAVGINERTFGPEHPNMANNLNNLAGIYAAQGKYAEAEAFLRRALTIRERAFGPHHPEVAQVFNNLAGVLCDQRKYTEAEQLHRSALITREKIFGPEHPDVANSLENYAALLRKTKRAGQAAQLEARAQAIRAKNA